MEAIQNYTFAKFILKSLFSWLLYTLSYTLYTFICLVILEYCSFYIINQTETKLLLCVACHFYFVLVVVSTNAAILKPDHYRRLLCVLGSCWGAVTAFKWAFCFSENEEFLSASTHPGWLEQNAYPSWVEIATAPDNMLCDWRSQYFEF